MKAKHTYPPNKITGPSLTDRIATAETLDQLNLLVEESKTFTTASKQTISRMARVAKARHHILSNATQPSK